MEQPSFQKIQSPVGELTVFATASAVIGISFGRAGVDAPYAEVC